MQVWSRNSGYPGAAAYLEFHKIRWPGGLRLWRVSEPGTDLGEKAPYEPEYARFQAAMHARHFTDLLDGVALEVAAADGSVIVAPFDTELFGHWWFEGPDFLRRVYASLSERERLRAVTAGAHLDAHPPRTALRLADGSWGRNGDYSMWENDLVAWTWPIIWDLEDEFWTAARDAIGTEEVHEILAQAARELLLLQSSDWQFIISTGEVDDYAIRRFNEHAADLRRLLVALRDAGNGMDLAGGLALAHSLQQRDDVFRTIVPAIRTALGSSATGGRSRHRSSDAAAAKRGGVSAAARSLLRP
jgi:1,4-alpha-glucan branching enzyme